MSVAVRIENVSKLYRLGTVGTGTISHDLNRWWHRVRGKEDPYAKVGQVNDRAGETASAARASRVRPDYVWALRDINLEVQQGEILGIIGRNGAGKSTLLKLLSRVTAPTTGQIKARGRIASLLEVGTGFHPELTGRENIYLNGVILGMKRHEITKELDEIVAFSGCGKYLDTPVKRYSSGMTVRLGFAVAAHLRCEILIVDEVLAVGDLEFQKKCLGKMRAIAERGRTVLFVSHNLASVMQLTEKSAVIEQGRLVEYASTRQAISRYMTGGTVPAHNGFYLAPASRPGNRVESMKVLTSMKGGVHHWGEPMAVEVAVRIDDPVGDVCFSLQVMNSVDQPIIHCWLHRLTDPSGGKSGVYRLRCEIPKLHLFMGSYTITTWLSDGQTKTLWEKLSNVCAFEVAMADARRGSYPWHPDECCYLEDHKWSVVEIAPPRGSTRSEGRDIVVPIQLPGQD